MSTIKDRLKSSQPMSTFKESMKKQFTFQKQMNSGIILSFDGLTGANNDINSLISQELIQTIVMNCIDTNKKELFLYARKEAIYSDALYLAKQEKQQSDNTKQAPKQEYDALYNTLEYNQFRENKIKQAFMTDVRFLQLPLINILQYENIIQKIGNTLTSQVSELLNKLVEEIYFIQAKQLQQQDPKLFASKSLSRDEIIKEIQTELNKFQSKYEQSKSLISNMRKSYLKEIQHLRAVEDVSFQNRALIMSQQKNNPKNNSRLSEQKNPAKDYLEVYFFTPTEGLDEETCKIFNNYFTKLRTTFESKLDALNTVNQELSWKVALIDESKKIAEMNSQELTELLFAKEKDQGVIWRYIKNKFRQETLEKIAEEEFADIINAITEKEIVSQVEKITEESKFQIQDAKEKLQKEINYLRLQINYRNEEIEKLKESKRIEIEKARLQSYEKAERRFMENLKSKEEKFNEEREQWKQKMEVAMKDDTMKHNSLILQSAMMKWRFIVSIIKLKSGVVDVNSHIDAIIESILEGQIKKYISRVEELEGIVKEQEKEKQDLNSLIEQNHHSVQEKDDKIELLIQELKNTHNDNLQLQSQIEELGSQMRGQQDEVEQHQRAKNVLQDLIHQLEKEKGEVEKKLAGSMSQQLQLHTQLQSLYESSGNEGHIPSALQTPMSNSLHPNVNMNSMLHGKFNSKLYAQKTVKNLIDVRKNEMGNVYSKNQNNVAVDTQDLIEFKNMNTQYKESHFINQDDQAEQEEAEEEQKRQAEIKRLTEMSFRFTEKEIQTETQGKWVEEEELNQLIENAQLALERGESSLKSQMKRPSSIQFEKHDSIKIPLVQEQVSIEQRELDEMDERTKYASMKKNIKQGKSNRVINSSSSKQFRQEGGRFMDRSRLENNNKDIDEQLDEVSIGNSEMFYQNKDIKNNLPQFDDEVYKKAMEYMQNKEIRKQHLRALSQQTNMKDLPQVYKRLWNDVAKKSKKAKDLQAHFDHQRRLEWVKLLQSNNHLNLNDRKSQEIITQLMGELNLKSLQSQIGITNQAQYSSVQQINMNRLIEVFSQEQEAQYQEALKKWQNQSNNSKIGQQQATQPISDYTSLYITEKLIDTQEEHQFNAPPLYNNNPQQQNQNEDKCIQTDTYLLDSLINRIPQYQIRLNQFMQNKQSHFNTKRSTGSNFHSNQTTSAANSINNSMISLNNSITQIPEYSHQQKQSIADQKKKALFMNSRIRQASIANRQRKVMTSTNSPKNQTQTSTAQQMKSSLVVDTTSKKIQKQYLPHYQQQQNTRQNATIYQSSGSQVGYYEGFQRGQSIPAFEYQSPLRNDIDPKQQIRNLNQSQIYQNNQESVFNSNSGYGLDNNQNYQMNSDTFFDMRNANTHNIFDPRIQGTNGTSNNMRMSRDIKSGESVTMVDDGDIGSPLYNQQTKGSFGIEPRLPTVIVNPHSQNQNRQQQINIDDMDD